MKSLLIKDTTKEEREAIVAESLGNIEGGCDGCAPGILEMYQPYIDGKMELRECNMAFRTHYVSGEDSRSETVVDMSGKQYDDISIW